MAEKRRTTQTIRYSPALYQRSRKLDDIHHDEDGQPIKSARLHHDDGPTTSSIKNESNCQQEIDVSGGNGEEEILIEDVGTSPCEIGSAIRNYNFQTNIDVMEYTPILTKHIQSLDVIDVLSSPMNGQEMRDCVAGLCVMVNRLISENQYLLREIQLLRNSQTMDRANRFDNLAFRKRNITREYIYSGDSFGIPEINFAPIIDRFDLNAIRRNEGAVNTLRRFVKFLLDNTIPVELHSKFTLRERSGVEHLVECPPELVLMIREMCLEAVNLGDVITEEDKEKREDMSDYINRFIKYALQEMRRMPRKAKRSCNPILSPTKTKEVEEEENTE